MHTKKVAVINLKGGCAKTTTTLQLATMLAGKEDKHVLVIDLDPQTNATLALIGEDRWKQLNDQGLTLHTLFRSALDGSGSVDISNLIQKDVGNIGDVPGLDLVPSSLDMVDLQDRIGLAGNNQFAYLNPTDILLHALSRLPEDLKAKFDELAKSSGLKQGELFAMLLDLADKDALKALVPDAATDIDAFDAHVHALRDAYVAAIMRAKDAYTIASDKVRNELNTFAALTQQNQQMQVENLTLSKKHILT